MKCGAGDYLLLVVAAAAAAAVAATTVDGQGHLRKAHIESCSGDGNSLRNCADWKCKQTHKLCAIRL